MMARAQPMHASARQAQRGMTLIELVVVIVLTAVIAAGVASVIGPGVRAQADLELRSQLMDQTDTAVRRLVMDVRRAVPNSIRSPSDKCFEVMPAMAGGRYRMAADTGTPGDAPGCSPSSTCSAPLDTTQTIAQFDSLSSLGVTPAAGATNGDWVVVNNQNTNDVYEGSNRARITSFGAAPVARMGVHRIGIASKQFPVGYDGGRFVIVPDAQKAVFYVCDGTHATAPLDASGNGKGTLYRLRNYGFNATYPSDCPSVTGAEVLLSGIESCVIVYDPNKGATQQSGFMSLRLKVTRSNESINLTVGAHVNNAP